jgi:aminoglycoside phosphotransferase (APT) family kinase protein
VASTAKNGIPCRIPALEDDTLKSSRSDIPPLLLCGGQNCHVDIEFEDGTTWIARMRLEDPMLPPRAVQDYITLSEIATLQFLARTTVPAPRVYAYQLESPDNPIGTAYVLMEKMPGRPLVWYEATDEQRAKVIEQLADVYVELEKHPFQEVGSLTLAHIQGQEHQIKVGGLAQLSWFESPNTNLGPFQTLEDANTTMIRLYLKAISSREQACLPIDNYLGCLWRLSAVPALAASSVSKNGPFYLRHGEDKGDHILVDDDFNITGIIDWEFAATTAKEFAFSSPCMMWPVASFYDGKNTLSKDELQFAKTFETRGRKDMSDFILNGRRWQRWLFSLSENSPQDKEEYEALFQGLRRSFIDGKDEEAISPYKVWKQEALETYEKVDPQLPSVLRMSE